MRSRVPGLRCFGLRGLGLRGLGFFGVKGLGRTITAGGVGVEGL